MRNEHFIQEVKSYFDFLISEFSFSIEYETISDIYETPSIRFKLDNIWVKITRGRGSLIVFVGKRNDGNISATYAEVLYFLDHGTLPSERGSGYGPGSDWNLDTSARLIGHMEWYRDHMKENIHRILELFSNPPYEDKLEKLIKLKRERHEKLQRFLQGYKNKRDKE